jgi:hypothetical protein
MKWHRSASRTVFAAISTLAVVSGTWVVGCGPSGVGSSPSSKEHIVEVVTKQDSASQLKNSRKPGKNVQGPKSIKTKIFKGDDGTPE